MFADQHARILEQVRRQPGVAAAGGTAALPLQIAWRMAYEIDGEAPRRADDRLIGQFQTVSDGYFESMKAPLVTGRGFVAFDTYTSAPVVLVNETFANRHRDSGRQRRRPPTLLTNTASIGPLGRNLMVHAAASRLEYAASRRSRSRLSAWSRTSEMHRSVRRWSPRSISARGSFHFARCF